MVSTVIPVLRRLRQKKNEFDASLDYILKKNYPPEKKNSGCFFLWLHDYVLVLSRMA